MAISLTPDPIRHVVHLILENRSFDQMLGCLKAVYPNLEGIDPATPAKNRGPDGRDYFQAPTTIRQMLKWDPHHEVKCIAVQLQDDNGGFVEDFVQNYPESTPEARQLIMSYYPLDFLPALHPLARTFRVCDHWFASLPGPTWPNRFFALSGTSNGFVDMPNDGTRKTDLPGYFEQTQETLFDRLNEQAIHWKIYFHDIPQSAVLNRQREPHNMARYFYIDEFFTDARDPEQDFPQYCLIEPDFLGLGQNDDHPPHDVMRAEKLIADVYNAIRANEKLWQSTLLVLMFDEHGGFFDHVVPPPAAPPDDLTAGEYAFNQYGIRVPAILVSPWVEPGVAKEVFDHTSVLKYLTDKWNLGPLGKRTAAAKSIGTALSPVAHQNTLTCLSLSVDQLNPPDPKGEEAAFGTLSSHQAALTKFTEWLETEAIEKAPRVASIAARLAMALKSSADHLLSWALDQPASLPVSIAAPDMLVLPRQAKPADRVAFFLMRMKQYGALGIQNRLLDPKLPPDQQEHSLQTLALITGRNFHQENNEEKTETAVAWLKKRTTNSR